MKIKALKSFAGKLTMRKGEVKEYGDKAVLQDLLNAGFIEEIKEAKSTKAKKGVSSDES